MSKMRSAARRGLVRATAVYGTVWLACLVLYWTSLGTGSLRSGIMGYTLLTLYAALPLAGLASALLVGRAAELGRTRLVAVPAIAALYALFIEVTFGLSNVLGLTKIAGDALSALAYGLVPAALGLAIGWATARRRAASPK